MVHRRIYFTLGSVMFVAVGLAFLAKSGPVLHAQAADLSDTTTEALMELKLASAQSLLRGIAVEDFQAIAKDAQRLHLLSRDVGWNILQTKDYIRFSNDFQNAAEQIRNAADAKNLDAASLGYLKLTMSCVDCHRHVRAVRQ